MIKKERKSNNSNEFLNDLSSSKRLKEIISILKKYSLIHGITPEKARLIFEELGPVYVKLGQIMSMRNDILPREYCNEFMKLRSEVKPLPFEQILPVIEQECGKPIEQIFLKIEPDPIGSGSIAQVHTAYLKNGEKVVLKVQRPNIYEIMERDIKLLKQAIKILKIVKNLGEAIDFSMIIDEMWAAAKQEMDFLTEAQHFSIFENYNKNIKYISCPKINKELTTERLLVMEHINGTPIDQTEVLEQLGYDMNEIGLKLAENYIKQIISDGFFHADPHPGNIWIRDGKIIWLDLGMVGKITPREQKLLEKAIIAVASYDIQELKTILLSIGIVKGKIDHSALYSSLDDMFSRFGQEEIGSLNIGNMFEEMMSICNIHHISMPRGITMLGRGIVTIEGVLASCCPKINFIQIMANHISSNMNNNINLNNILKSSLKDVYFAGKKTVALPNQISDILNMTIKGQTKFNIELTSANDPMDQLDHTIDKLVICIIVAALLIGSSLICATNMQPKFLGIPALGAIGYITAIILGLWLVIRILCKQH